MAKEEESAGAVIYFYDEEPNFLLLKYATYWGFAKGWIEKGETEEEAAKREVREETGLKVEFIPGFKFEQNWVYRFKGELRRKHAVYFLAKVSKKKSEDVRISDEHEDFAWKIYSNALKIVKIRNNREMLEQARDFIIKNDKQNS